MKLKVVFRRAARAEFLDDAARYAELRADLGLDFVIEIDRCTSLISERPQQYPVVCQNIRRISARRFPFGVYFRAESNRVVVLAVFHNRRDPMIWQSRS